MGGGMPQMGLNMGVYWVVTYIFGFGLYVLEVGLVWGSSALFSAFLPRVGGTAARINWGHDVCSGGEHAGRACVGV